nr:thioredoxin-related transmembrane protein 1 [Meriones unguiculatus]
MAHLGRLLVPLAALVLLLWAVPGAHGRRSNVRVLTDENWTSLLEGEWMIELYLLVIFSCKDGEFRRYLGPRTKKDFINFISEKEWKNVEPVSSWFGPSSVLMTTMSALFQLSVYIRTSHSYFVHDLGIPAWGSYLVFAFATVFSGLLLGLCMIFVADCFCPSKRRKPQQPPTKKPSPELSQPLKKVEEEQEADEEDVSEEETENKEGASKDTQQSGLRQRSVGPSLATDKS